ncbi:lipopolysaccharide biosynthesis protein [Marinobacter salsuginis]|nr:oligosaccharide flippase family protein [Marinobacter salsuginis]
MKNSKGLKRLFSEDAARAFKGMATMAVGSGLGRLISLLAIPFATRIYTPEGFGVLAVFTSLVTILAPIVSLRYVLTLPLPRQTGTALNLLLLSFGLILAGTAFIMLALAIFSEPMLNFFSMAAIVPWWWLIGIGVLVTATYELMTFWATRRRAYGIIAKTNIIQNSAGALATIGLGVVGLNPLGLLLGAIIAKGGGLFWLLRDFKTDLFRIPQAITANRLATAAGFYRDFPFYRVPSQFLMVFSQQAPLLFAAAVYGAELTGQLSLALMALAIPVTLVGEAMGKALYAEAAAIGKSGSDRIYQMTKDTQKKLFLVSIPSGLVLFFFGEQIFYLVFGQEWEASGKFASLLSIYIVFHFTSAPLVQLLNIMANQSTFLRINVVRVLSILALFSFVFFTKIAAARFIFLYSILMAFFYIYVSVLVMHILKKKSDQVRADCL